MALAALVQFLRAKTAMHFSVFSGPGAYFWRGENPYPLLFVPGNDEQRYLYSPAFSMFFFHPFSKLPELWGRLAYVGLSLLVFLGGFTYWLKHAEQWHHFRLSTHPWKNWLAAGLAAELFGAIYYCKIEVLELGLFFAMLVPLVNGSTLLPFFLMGVLGEIKFQTVPVLGLMLIVASFLGDRPVRSALAAVLGYLSGEVAVMLALTPQTWLELTRARFATMDYIVDTYWATHYQHLYKTFLTAGVPLSLEQAKWTAVAMGSVFATALYLHLSYWRERLNPVETRSLGYLSAYAFGLTYLLLFSPMSQSNAYTLVFPLFLLVFLLNPRGTSRATLGLLLLSLFLISGIYSDLVPLSWRLWARAWSVKPWGLIPLYLAVIKDTYLARPILAPHKAWPLAWTGP